MALTETQAAERAVLSPKRLLPLYLLLGFSAGLPFFMFNAVLLLRLSRHGVDVTTIGYFAWVALLPTFKFVWSPLIDRFAAPGFSRFWGKRRGWIMLSQLGIFSAMVGMAFTSSDTNLALVALFATLLAFWTTTLEVAADGWRIDLAPTQEQQAPLVAANLWGYRSAMVAAGSGAILIAARTDWTTAYLVIALAALAPFPLLAATRAEPGSIGTRWSALASGAGAGAIILMALAGAFALLGAMALAAAAGAGVGSDTNLTPVVIVLALLPFVLLSLALPRIRSLPAGAPLLRSTTLGPFVDIFWRFGFGTLLVLVFVSFYRVGDVLALTLSHPMWDARGYSLDQIGIADGAVALPASIAGVALGSWMAARLNLLWALAGGALVAALGNAVYVWLWWQEPASWVLYTSVAVDQFGNGMAGAVFVVYLSMLVNPRFPAAQYAFLSGFAFLLARLLAGASGEVQLAIGYDGFFAMTAAASVICAAFLPFLARIRPRQDSLPQEQPA